MTTIDHIDSDQIERDDAARAIDAQTDAAAEALYVELTELAFDAIVTAQVKTCMSRGWVGIAELVHRMMSLSGGDLQCANAVRVIIESQPEIAQEIRDRYKREALTAASHPTPREIALHGKLNAIDALLTHYMREARTLRDRLNEKKVA